MDLNDFRWFGCIAYIHIQHDKISPRSVKGIFMGYCQADTRKKNSRLLSNRTPLLRRISCHRRLEEGSHSRRCSFSGDSAVNWSGRA
ncbi:unnamed protein product [Arabidopsis halleri]